jgi:endonuclease III
MRIEIINKIYKTLKTKLKNYPAPLAKQIYVKWKDPFFVLISTILSARTKDKITSKVCDRLFLEIKSWSDLERITIKDLEKLIYPVGFYKTKAKHLKELPKAITVIFIGQFPSTIDNLIKLPGVGRKTANLVMSVCFNKPAICVDTHVHRITNRIGILNSKTPYETEMNLRKILPQKYWSDTNYLLVILGQNICFPRNPNCKSCPINKYCKKINT